MSRKVVFIMGTGHCGSTLLDLILGSHSNIRSLGELNSIKTEDIGAIKEFWKNELLKKIDNHYNYKKNRLLAYDFFKFPQNRLFENRAKLYQKIFLFTSKKILIDSSKQLAWVKRGVNHLEDDIEIEPKIIYLYRNPLAVVNSYKRKKKNSIEEIAENIKKRIKKNNTYFAKTSREKFFLSYEEFCLDPSGKTQELCKFLNVKFEEDMLEYWKFKHYNISGNSGTRSLIDKYHKRQFKLDRSRNDKDYYQSHEFKIKLDERWKKELSDKEVKIIKKLMPESYLA